MDWDQNAGRYAPMGHGMRSSRAIGVARVAPMLTVADVTRSSSAAVAVASKPASPPVKESVGMEV